MFELPNGGDSNACVKVRNCGQGEAVRCRIGSLYRVERMFECVAGLWTGDSRLDNTTHKVQLIGLDIIAHKVQQSEQCKVNRIG